jgi:molybdenum cofactor guanylyltransferase
MGQSSIAGLVLAGGKSSRMGQDKALLDYQGQPLLRYQMQKLEDVGCQPIAISAPPGRGYEKFTKLVIKDLIPNLGPMGGIYSVLKKLEDVEKILVLGVDLPNVTTEFLSRLIEKSEGYDATFPVSRHGAEPLCAIYQAKLCLSVIEERIQLDDLSLQRFINAMGERGRNLEIEPAEWTWFGDDLLKNWNEP